MRRYGLALGSMALIAVLSLTPDQPEPDDSAFVWLVHFTPTLAQKVLHVVIYAGLTVVLSWSLRAPRSSMARRVIALSIAVGFGALMEFGQTFVPGRFGSLADIVLNGVGALAGVAAAPLALRWVGAVSEGR